MKPVIMGKMNLIFSRELEHTDRDLAFLETAFLVDDLSVLKVDVIVTNNLGQRTVLNGEDWSTSLLEVFDEDGLPV